MRFCFLIVLMALFLTACASNEVKPVQIPELQREAARAYQLKNWKEAEERYAELVNLLPGEAMLWFRLGNVYAHTHKPDEAIAAYKEALVRDPKLSKAWHNMSVMSLRQTTHLFIEMVKYLEPDDPLYKKAVSTAEALIVVMKQRQENIGVLESLPQPLIVKPHPAEPATPTTHDDPAQ